MRLLLAAPGFSAALALLPVFLLFEGTARGGELLGLAWSSGRVHYRINPNFTDPSLARTPDRQVDVITCAARSWRETTRADFEFVHDGTTAMRGVDLEDGENVISLVDADGENALAATFLSGSNGVIDAFDIVFFRFYDDQELFWSALAEPPEDTIDIAGIATHEFGHALGLAHVDNGESTMFLTPRRRGLIMRSLHDVDRACIESLYGLRTAELPGTRLFTATPAVGPTIGGNEVIIEGFNFTYTTESRLLVGGEDLPRASWEVESCDRIRIFEMPAHPPGTVDVRHVNAVGEDTVENLYEFDGPQLFFVRGDANADGVLDVSDALLVLGVLFLGDPAGFSCDRSADANDSAVVDIADVLTVLSHLFLGAPALPAPFPTCAMDPTADDLACLTFAACR